MKSEYENRDTLGTQLLKTQKDHQKSSPIEAYELAHEGGKSYMRELIDCIEKHRTLINEYYIQVLCKKEIYAPERITKFIFIARRSKPLMEDDMDLWYVNNKKNELKLLWSLPHWSDFDLFLNNQNDYDPNLIKWIKIYKSLKKDENY